MIIIIAGSGKDAPTFGAIVKHLDILGVPSKVEIASAHKTPEYLLKILTGYENRQKPLVYITVAGRSNALGGFVDAQTAFPVINCPPKSENYAGLDILSSLRMPSGVAALTVLEPDQAAIAAVKILALESKVLRRKITAFQKQMRQEIVNSNK
ncbi:MAG: phosphoribosylaminoimidazole carboxylase catalytic subunit, 5-(carboxyamino)imidazole ribonucleotide mutase [Candidatus Gottesmanbacteria bacterium GW2011_GWA2_43_14]|uniref:N5-carboxyaminoimidazole ribonucleotide mutase n=1 Tax=Candidatus Gottesmanbacteria bacterium GW2011_GWA2_43_14 TaxID=1618443 RepID=A0A0G1FU06_9BACT|nr:MAG: phosphoribosylaminoimidazole carboxylase catalytic subunit, 5-(carboxyamino)imidazole ribonucleotide mutase [Candidatus Gottesmanbacteria bacterium GW2011_GWA2_43_14]